MKLSELFRRVDRVQHSRRFKIGATIAIALLTVGLYTALLVTAHRPGAERRILQREMERLDPARLAEGELGPIDAAQGLIDSALLAVSEPGGWITAGVLFLGVGAAATVAVWLGLALSYLALLVVGWGVALPLLGFDGTLRTLGEMILGVVPLTLAFLTLMQILRWAFSGPSPALAVARNVLSEAVRMKISLVFIVLLILFLVLVPNMLTEDQPLRYRVQQWMQYGLGFGYAVLALLTVFLSAGTVAFEQRDRIIWQTMTKPVTPWAYVLGKWLGVMGLNAVLLTVTATGVFLFTEYLRHQPANGEIAYHVREDGAVTRHAPGQMTTDRRILETQVLTARRGIQATSPYDITAMVDEMLERRVDRIIAENVDLVDDAETRERLRARHRPEVYDEVMAQARSVAPGGSRAFEFEGVGRALSDYMTAMDEVEERLEQETQRRLREAGLDPERVDDERVRGVQNTILTEWHDAGELPAPPTLTLRYQIHAAGNDPTALYNLMFLFNGVPYPEETNGERQVALKSAQYISIPGYLVDDDGKIIVEVLSAQTNPKSFVFPPDGLEILYPAGSYAANFGQVIAVIWVKLAFIGAVAIACATFLSFPVACLVALCVLFAAESASFLASSVGDYAAFAKVRGYGFMGPIVSAIATPIAWAFGTYAELRPISKLADGRLVGFTSMLNAVAIIGAWVVIALGAGIAIFRSRELATYSGH